MPYQRSLTQIANNHDFDKVFTAEYSFDQTNATILTPTAGTSLVVTGYYVTTSATTGKSSISLDSDTIATEYATGEAGFIPTYKVGARNSTVKITTTYGADKNYFVAIYYHEI